MKLGFWNVAKFAHPGSVNLYQSLAQKCDITCIQEWRANHAGQNANSTFSIAFTKDSDACGVLTSWSAAAPMLTRAARYTTDLEFWVQRRKSALITQHLVGDKPLLVINVHGFNGWPFKKVEPLMRQLEVFTTEIIDFSGAVVACGDFNTSTDARMDAVNSFFRDLDFDEHIATDYPSSHKTLDHAYGRGCELITLERIRGGSDHSATVVGVKL